MTQRDNIEPTRLILIRHGESTANRMGVIGGWSTDVTLTEPGRMQARQTGELLRRSVAIDTLYSSPLPRAWETATIIGEAIGLEPVPVDDLREINVGIASGQPLSGLASLFPRSRDYPGEDKPPEGIDVAWPGGESHLQLRERAMRAIETIVRDHPGETVAAVSHGGPLAWIVLMLAADETRAYREWRHENCAISELSVWLEPDGLGAQLIRFNDCAHLGDE